MVALNLFKLDALPAQLSAHSLYFIENNTFAETYITDAAGVARSVGNTAMIEAIATALIAPAVAALNRVEIVANIAARNALAANNRNQMVLVRDATGDATVAAGAALYVFQNSDDTWTKVAEYEGMDVALTWAALSGKPNSAPASIDDAVNKRHAHANIAQLDQIGEDGAQNLTYRGSLVGGANWTGVDW